MTSALQHTVTERRLYALVLAFSARGRSLKLSCRKQFEVPAGESRSSLAGYSRFHPQFRESSGMRYENSSSIYPAYSLSWNFGAGLSANRGDIIDE